MNHPNENTTSQNFNKTFLLCIFIGIICIVMGATVLKNASSNILEGIDLHLGRMISNIGVVLVFIKVIDTFFYKPLSEAINQRNDEIEAAYIQADTLRIQMNQTKADYEKKLADTEAIAKIKLHEQMKETSQLRETIIQESQKRAKDIIDQAEEEIKNYRSIALHELKTQTIDLTLKATEKIILKNIDNEVNQNLIKEFIEQLEIKKYE